LAIGHFSRYRVTMQIRSGTLADLDAIREIDGTVESLRYFHVEQAGGEGSSIGWRLDERPMREKLIEPNRLTDESEFSLKQVLSGADEGSVWVVQIGDRVVASLLARPQPDEGTLLIADLRVDYEFRRQGMGTALVYQAIQQAREGDVRAIAATTLTNNAPASGLLARCGFELSGVDTRRRSNHDLVKEAVTLFWYAVLD
jgi:RimJ/RimL family protein N-acetyltransferase